MSTEVKRRRGTTLEHSSFTGALGEITIDLDKDTVVVHDGATQGGFPLLREDFSNVPSLAPFQSVSLDVSNFNVSYSPTGNESQGAMYWNPDELTLSVVTNGTTIDLGQHTEIQVKNNSGSTIGKGQVVYATGTVGNSGIITIGKMICDGTIEAKYVLGVTHESIPNGSDGKVVKLGKLRHIDTASFSEGDVLWASTTVAGAFQNTEPSQENGEVSITIAFVVTEHANVGEIFVRVTPVDENEHAKYTDFVNLTSDVLTNYLEIQSLFDTKVEKGFLFSSGDGQSVGTSSSVTFSQVTVNGDILLTGTVDGRDVAGDGNKLDELYTTIGLSSLTSSEVDQLENIGGKTISNAQWGYLGSLDQSLRRNDAVTFVTVNTGQGDNELYAMNQDVQTTDSVEFLDVTSTLLLGDTDKIESDSGYSSSSGMNLSKVNGEWNLHLDNIDLRGSLFASEFIINQISAVNGSDILSAGRGKVEAVSGNDITVSDPQSGNRSTFEDNDIIIIQQFKPHNNSIVKRIVRKVSSVSNNVITVTTLTGAPSDTGSIEVGDIIVSIGNTSDADRQSSIYRTVVESDGPYVRISDNVSSWSDWLNQDNMVLQYGNLEGISYNGSTLSGYGVIVEDNFYVTLGASGTPAYLGKGANPNDSSDDGIYFDADNYWLKSGFKASVGGEDLSEAIAEIQSDLIQIHLNSEAGFSGIQFLSGQLILSAGSGDSISSIRLDGTVVDQTTINLNADYITLTGSTIFRDSDSSSDVSTGLGSATFIDGGNIVTDSITATQIDVSDLFAETITFSGTIGDSSDTMSLKPTSLAFGSGASSFGFGSDDGVYMDATGNFFTGVVGADEPFLKFDATAGELTGRFSDVDITADTFALTSNDLSLQSGTNAKLSVGNMDFGLNVGGSGVDGISIDSNNYWYDTGSFNVGAGSGQFINFDGSALSIKTQEFDLTAGDLTINNTTSSSVSYSPNANTTLIQNASFDSSITFYGVWGNDYDDVWSGDRLSFGSIAQSSGKVTMTRENVGSSNRLRLWQDETTLTSYEGKSLEFTWDLGVPPTGSAITVGNLYVKVYGYKSGSRTTLAITTIDASTLTGTSGNNFTVEAFIPVGLDKIRWAIEVPEEDTSARSSDEELFVNEVSLRVYDRVLTTLNANGLSVYNSPTSYMYMNSSEGFETKGFSVKASQMQLPFDTDTEIQTPDDGYVSLSIRKVGVTYRLYIKLEDGTTKYVNLS